MGSPDNVVHNIFWVANIPGDWMAINETAVVELSEFAPTMVVGRNSRGDRGMEPPCPEKGMHRYHVVMWSLDSQLDDIDSDISYGALKSLLEVLFTLPAEAPKEYERGGEYFEVNEALFRRQTECDDFRSMPYGFVCTGDMSDSREQQEIVRAFERTAQFLRKFLWPFPLGGGYAYLRYLAGKGDVEAMKKLLDMGVPAGGRDSQDEIEQAPVIYAAREGFAQACKVLAQYQADVNEVGGVARETALHVAVQHNKVRVVQTLLNLQANPQLQDSSGQAPLHKAARDGTVSCLQTLIAAAAMIDPRDTCEQTPVHIACFFGREDIVSKLFTARADVVAENIRGQTPRKVADRHSFSTLVQLIDKEIEKREIEEHYANEEREKEAQQALKAIEFDERPSSKASKRSGLSKQSSSRPGTRESHRSKKK
ncbi:unnamed protein product [Durusdinium trenchii]|uniref:Uncharacterized protein n=1 Tax=Durusdinium trenchii TaxID=1381693 RepID=A0ABP0KZF2_9DINO